MFNGFVEPESNFFKLPNEWIDITSEIDSLAELKVIVFVLRHTWGFHDKCKKLTTDEFVNGKKSKKYPNGRMDKGTGLSRQSVITGLKKAVEHGYLLVKINDSDKGRTKKYYSLNMKTRGQDVRPQGVQDLDPKGQDVRPRTEKDTYRKTPSSKKKKGRLGKSPPTKPGLFDSKNSGTKSKIPPSGLSKFDMAQGRKLKSIMMEHGTDLEICKIKTFAESVRDLRLKRKVPEDRIAKVISQYSGIYKNEYSPKLYKKTDFVKNFSRIEDAIARIQNEDNPGNTSGVSEDTLNRIRSLVFNHQGNCNCPKQSLVDEMLEKLGLEPGTVQDVDL